MMGKRLVLIGGGGHCKSVLDAALCMNIFEEIVITDHKISAGSKIMGCKVIGNDILLSRLYIDGFTQAFIALGSIKSTKQREKIYQKASAIGFKFPNIIDPSAILSKEISLGKGIFIGKKAVINSGSTIGDMSIINTGAIIEHDCQIGNFSHIAVSAVICGGCEIGDSTFVGANTTIIQGVKIGMNCIIGAGSIVLGNVSENNKVIGTFRGE